VVKETAIVGRDSVSFRVVDRFEANPTNDRFTKGTTCRIPIKRIVEKRDIVQINPQSPGYPASGTPSCLFFLRCKLPLPCSLLLSPKLIPLTFLPEGNGKNVGPKRRTAPGLQTLHIRCYLVVLSTQVKDALLSIPRQRTTWVGNVIRNENLQRPLLVVRDPPPAFYPTPFVALPSLSG